MSEWVVLRRYDDGLEAEIARSFLQSHGVRAILQGNSGASSILNRFDTVIDIRLVVPAEELDHARDVFAAMTPDARDVEPEPPAFAEPWAGSPYRASGGHGAAALAAEPEDDHVPRRRYRRAAFALAFALPIGAGCFYARHEHAGAILGLGIVGYAAVGLVRGDHALLLAALLLVAFDAVLGTALVAKHNAGRSDPPARQGMLAAVGLVGAVTAALAVAG